MNRRNFLAGALAAIPIFGLKLPRLKSDVPRLKAGEPGADDCRILDAYTGKDITNMDFMSVDCETGVTERWPLDWNPERGWLREHRWAVIRLHPKDK
jgi:hypothetical protein